MLTHNISRMFILSKFFGLLLIDLFNKLLLQFRLSLRFFRLSVGICLIGPIGDRRVFKFTGLHKSETT